MNQTDLRPTFKRSDYRMVVSEERDTLRQTASVEDLDKAACQWCSGIHDVLTRYCHPVAFPLLDGVHVGISGRAIPVDETAVPLSIEIAACSAQDGIRQGPHSHEGLFRWID